jgi:AraC-like DNA-binding protein
MLEKTEPASRASATTQCAPFASSHDGVLDVTVVLLEDGYEDIAFFRGLFKRHTGMTPGEYRASFAQMNVRRGALAGGRPAA